MVTSAPASAVSALENLESRPNNLPRHPTSFLERERRVEEVAGLMRKDEMLLLTLAGPDGKTGLARKAA